MNLKKVYKEKKDQLKRAEELSKQLKGFFEEDEYLLFLLFNLLMIPFDSLVAEGKGYDLTRASQIIKKQIKKGFSVKFKSGKGKGALDSLIFQLLLTRMTVFSRRVDEPLLEFAAEAKIVFGDYKIKFTRKKGGERGAKKKDNSK